MCWLFENTLQLLCSKILIEFLSLNYHSYTAHGKEAVPPRFPLQSLFWIFHAKQFLFSNKVSGCRSAILLKKYLIYNVFGYLNIKSLRSKIISLREITQKIPIDILCVGETKLDESFPGLQIKIDRISKGGGKIVINFEGLIAKRLSDLETTSTERISLKLTTSKKKKKKKKGVLSLHKGLQINAKRTVKFLCL